jgi:hypothetical protein
MKNLETNGAGGSGLDRSGNLRVTVSDLPCESADQRRNICESQRQYILDCDGRRY